MTDHHTDPSIRERLLADRESTLDLIAQLDRDLRTIVDSSALVATDDEHDPEGATIAFERAQTSHLLEQSRAQLAALDRALGRLADGSLGTCERCGEPIGAERLVARPAATTCIRCAASPTVRP